MLYTYHILTLIIFIIIELIMLGLLLESILLILNAVAILNEKRFLSKCKSCMSIDGFDTKSVQPNSPNEVITSKSQIIMMVFAVRSVGKCSS